MIKFVPLLIIALMLGGCATDQQPLIQDRYIVITPPESLYNCPQLVNLPNPAKLTDLQVARLLSTLAKNNKICGVSVASLKKFYVQAKKQYGG